jgi:hypothetical protein
MDTLALFCISTAAATALSLLALLLFYAKKSPTGRRVSLIFVGVFGIGAFSGCVYLADRDPSLRTLAEMQAAFPADRAHLVTLLRMSDQDKALTAIASDYITATPTSASPRALFRYGDSTAPLPQPHWNEYRKLLQPYGSLASVERTAFGDVTIYTWNGPWRGLYRATGYTHCTTTPALPAQGSSFRGKPCGDAVLLDAAGPADPSAGSHLRFSNILPLNDNWYAFEIGID